MASDPVTGSAADRCATCRHWDQVGPRSEWRVDIRLKPLPGHGPSYEDEQTQERTRLAEALYGRCQAINLLDSYDEVAEDELPLAFCKDGSDYMADLYTRAEFGCALWEAPDGT